MPESNDQQICPITYNGNNGRTNLLASAGRTVTLNRVSCEGQSKAMDFTTNQSLRLKAGDMRVARIRLSLTKLQTEMEQSNKLVEQLCQEVQLDIKSAEQQ